MTNIEVLADNDGRRIGLAIYVFALAEAAKRYLRDDDVAAKLAVGFLAKWCVNGKVDKLFAVNNTLKAELDRASVDHLRWLDATATVERDKKTGKRKDGNGPLYRYHVILALYNLSRFASGSGETEELLVVLQALDEIPLHASEDIDDPADTRPTSFADMLEAAGELTNRNTLKDLE